MTIRLRPPELRDAESITEAVLSSLPALAPWMPWASSDYSTKSACEWLSGKLGDIYTVLIVDERDECLGTCAINNFDELNQRANLGYWVRSDQTGKGYATQAATHVAKHGLSLGLKRIEILMSIKNEPSRKVADRIGAHYEGIARNRLLLHGVSHDAHMFSIIPQED